MDWVFFAIEFVQGLTGRREFLKNMRKLDMKKHNMKVSVFVYLLGGIVIMSMILVGISTGLDHVKGTVFPERRAESGSVMSSLDDISECSLCGSKGWGMVQYLKGCDDLGIICLNSGYVMEMYLCNSAPLETPIMSYVNTGEQGYRFERTNYTDHCISEISICLGGGNR